MALVADSIDSRLDRAVSGAMNSLNSLADKAAQIKSDALIGSSLGAGGTLVIGAIVAALFIGAWSLGTLWTHNINYPTQDRLYMTQGKWVSAIMSHTTQDEWESFQKTGSRFVPTGDERNIFKDWNDLSEQLKKEQAKK